MLVGQNKFKELGQQWMLRAKKIFPRAILGTRAIGSSALILDVKPGSLCLFLTTVKPE